MEDISILQFFSPKSKPERLSILVIGPYNSIERLKPELLFENERKYANRLHIQFCVSIEEIKNSSTEFFSDYIVILTDPKDRAYLSKIESIIAQLDTVYLCGRLILVNCNCDLKPSEGGTQRTYLTLISDKYQLNLINGNITSSDKCAYLAGRILNTATAVCGYKTGYSVNLDPPLSEDTSASMTLY